MKAILTFPYIRALGTLAGVVLVGGATVLGYHFVRAEIAADVYRRRLSELAGNYESLRQTYNEAVRRTAVTELVVRNGRLSVLVRSAAGTIDELATPFDPSREIYVDFVLIDGRLWIRRVFDSRTPPGEGLLIDPALGGIDWNSPSAAYGKAVYRRLDEGRWIVTVSGDGSLGLAKASGEPLPLVHAPEIREYDEATKQADDVVRSIGFGDVLRRVLFEK